MSEGRRLPHMPKFHISVVNEEFTACEERELRDAEAARQEALRGAIAIGADQLCDGAKLFGAEVSVGEHNGPNRRFVVTVGASPLKDPTE
jgi:hypothetical protein